MYVTRQTNLHTSPQLCRLISLDVTTEDFAVPEHYIRYIEPIESELATQVEYDMDEQGL